MLAKIGHRLLRCLATAEKLLKYLLHAQQTPMAYTHTARDAAVVRSSQFYYAQYTVVSRTDAE